MPVQIDHTGIVSMPAFLGVFIDVLAGKVETLVLFASTANVGNASEYKLRSKNIEFVSLGPVTPPYVRFYFPALTLRKIKSALNTCDFLLLRSPSPLAPAFRNFFPKDKIVYMVVGSYKEGSKHLQLPIYKLWAVKLLNIHMHHSLSSAISGARVLVNSGQLFSEYERLAGKLQLVYTTTLSKDDFFFRHDTCLEEPVKLLFVGRIDIAKGLKECITVCSKLKAKGVRAELTIIGWELYDKLDVTNQLKKMVQDLQVEHLVHFLGAKKGGIELLNYYRSHDIYVLPTYYEGFPRTIWEALANSIPVISTSVGSIPFFLKNEIEALLIEPKSSDQLLDAIVRIVEDGNFRRDLIRNGFQRVQEVQLDIQTQKIVDFIENE